MDLTKTIKINAHYQISYGRLLLTGIVTLFEMLAIICLHNWQIVPEVFFLLSSMFLALSKRSTETELIELDEKIDQNRELILKQNETIKEIKAKVIGDSLGSKSERNEKRKKEKN